MTPTQAQLCESLRAIPSSILDDEWDTCHQAAALIESQAKQIADLEAKVAARSTFDKMNIDLVNVKEQLFKDYFAIEVKEDKAYWSDEDLCYKTWTAAFYAAINMCIQLIKIASDDDAIYENKVLAAELRDLLKK